MVVYAENAKLKVKEIRFMAKFIKKNQLIKQITLKEKIVIKEK